MFAQPKKILITANRLASRNISYRQDVGKNAIDTTKGIKQLHTTTVRPNYAAAAILPIPNNIDAAETTRFSPHRARDISANVILSQYGQLSNIDITTDNTVMSSNASGAANQSSMQDPHVQSYDCFGAVSLNSVMQSNVPQPFGGMHKFSHLNMPGGQWSQEGKFTSQNLHSSHYHELRNNARSSWATYDQDATLDKKESLQAINQCSRNAAFISSLSSSSSSIISSSLSSNVIGKRFYCTKTQSKVNAEKVGEASASASTSASTSTVDQNVQLSKTEQLKRAFKEYGSTIVIFHVAISLVSLGGFYALISSGVDLLPLVEALGLTSSLANKIVAGAGTFTVAYAIHKVFAPFRISITLASAPFIVRYLRSRGILKVKNTQSKK